MTAPSVAPLTEAVTLTIPMTPDRRMAHNRSRGKSMWTMGEWIKADREKAYRLCDMLPMYGFELSTVPTMEHMFTCSVRVTITIHWGKERSQKDGKVRQARRLDWDSATALVKPMIDGALVDTGIMADDRQIVAGTVWQDVDKSGDGYTVIIVTPVADAPGGVPGE